MSLFKNSKELGLIREKIIKAQEERALMGKKLSPNSKLIKEYKNYLPTTLPQKYFSIILGHMLGDVSLKHNSNTKQTCIKFEWGKQAYADYVYGLLKPYILSPPRVQTRKNASGNLVTTYCFQTISHRSFNVFYDLFIVEGKKTVIKGLIKNYLTPLALATWYMDDGSLTDYRSGHGQGVQLHTQGFTKEAVEQMVTELNDKYQFNCWMRLVKKGRLPIICLPSESYSLFYEIVKDYVDSSMIHKLPKPK